MRTKLGATTLRQTPPLAPGVSETQHGLILQARDQLEGAARYLGVVYQQFDQRDPIIHAIVEALSFTDLAEFVVEEWLERHPARRG